MQPSLGLRKLLLLFGIFFVDTHAARSLHEAPTGGGPSAARWDPSRDRDTNLANLHRFLEAEGLPFWWNYNLSLPVHADKLEQCRGGPQTTAFPGGNEVVLWLNDELKLVYLLNPKTGSSLIRDVFQKVFQGRHISFDEYNARYRFDARYTLFTFVRDPVQRFLSGVQEAVAGRTHHGRVQISANGVWTTEKLHQIPAHISFKFNGLTQAELEAVTRAQFDSKLPPVQAAAGVVSAGVYESAEYPADPDEALEFALRLTELGWDEAVLVSQKEIVSATFRLGEDGAGEGGRAVLPFAFVGESTQITPFLRFLGIDRAEKDAEGHLRFDGNQRFCRTPVGCSRQHVARVSHAPAPPVVARIRAHFARDYECFFGAAAAAEAGRGEAGRHSEEEWEAARRANFTDDERFRNTLGDSAFVQYMAAAHSRRFQGSPDAQSGLVTAEEAKWFFTAWAKDSYGSMDLELFVKGVGRDADASNRAQRRVYLATLKDAFLSALACLDPADASCAAHPSWAEHLPALRTRERGRGCRPFDEAAAKHLLSFPSNASTGVEGSEAGLADTPKCAQAFAGAARYRRWLRGRYQWSQQSPENELNPHEVGRQKAGYMLALLACPWCHYVNLYCAKLLLPPGASTPLATGSVIDTFMVFSHGTCPPQELETLKSAYSDPESIYAAVAKEPQGTMRMLYETFVPLPMPGHG